jgi:DNA-binding NarL/FixJ family response regulator
MASLIRALVVDDHPTIVNGVEAAVRSANDIMVVGGAQTLVAALGAIQAHSIDVVLCDILLRDERALDLPHRIGERPPVVFFTSFDYPAYVAAAIDAGAAGFLLKTASPDEIIAALRTAAAGGTVFKARDLRAARAVPRHPSARELEVIRGVAVGQSNDEIGLRLDINARTVDSHLRRLFGRYGVLSRTELAMLAVREGWIEP